MSIGDQKFDTWGEWVTYASRVLTSHPRYREGEDWAEPNAWRALCFDAKGRACRSGADFRLAKEEGAFPVRWVWPDQMVEFARWSSDNPSFVGMPRPITTEDVQLSNIVGGPNHGRVHMVAHRTIMGTSYDARQYVIGSDEGGEIDQQLEAFVQQANEEFSQIYAEVTYQKDATT